MAQWNPRDVRITELWYEKKGQDGTIARTRLKYRLVRDDSPEQYIEPISFSTLVNDTVLLTQVESERVEAHQMVSGRPFGDAFHIYDQQSPL